MTKTLIDKPENWDPHQAKTGYYDPIKDEIHICDGVDYLTHFAIEIHENVHASRRNKFTLKLSTFFQKRLILLIISTIALAILAPIITPLPLYSLMTFDILCLFSWCYEELTAIYLTNKTLNQIREGKP
jgi:hypothetical protein